MWNTSTSSRPDGLWAGPAVQEPAAIFGKLTNPALYTGSHRHRFDGQGNGKGWAGHDNRPIHKRDAFAEILRKYAAEGPEGDAATTGPAVPPRPGSWSSGPAAAAAAAAAAADGGVKPSANAELAMMLKQVRREAAELIKQETSRAVADAAAAAAAAAVTESAATQRATVETAEGDDETRSTNGHDPDSTDPATLAFLAGRKPTPAASTLAAPEEPADAPHAEAVEVPSFTE